MIETILIAVVGTTIGIVVHSLNANVAHRHPFLTDKRISISMRYIPDMRLRRIPKTSQPRMRVLYGNMRQIT